MALICLQNAALSFVAEENEPEFLLVQAYSPGEIEAVFPQARIEEISTPHRAFRALIPRAHVASAIVERLLQIDYRNLGDAVRERSRLIRYRQIMELVQSLPPAHAVIGAR